MNSNRLWGPQSRARTRRKKTKSWAWDSRCRSTEAPRARRAVSTREGSGWVRVTAPESEIPESDLHESEKVVMTSSALHEMGLASPSLAQTFPHHRCLSYRDKYLKASFSKKLGGPPRKEVGLAAMGSSRAFGSGHSESRWRSPPYRQELGGRRGGDGEQGGLCARSSKRSQGSGEDRNGRRWPHSSRPSARRRGKVASGSGN